MNLLVDIGNSRIKWCAATGRRLGEVSGLAHERGAMPVALELAWRDLPPPTRILVCSVADPQLQSRIGDLTEQLWGQRPEYLAVTRECLGLHNAYPVPENLGPDRWAALLAAHAEGIAPCIIVDAGTAVTVDVLAEGGDHRGGVIFAGLELSRHALTARAHRLPPVADGELPVLAVDTPEAIRLGTREALVGALERLLRRIHERHGRMRLLVTGGDAPLLLEALGGEAPEYRPELGLAGLAAVLEGRQ